MPSSKILAVETEGRVLNWSSVLEGQVVDLSDGCEVKRNKSSLTWVWIVECWGHLLRRKAGHSRNWFREENQSLHSRHLASEVM